MKWHTHSAGQKAGPYSVEELRTKITSGELVGETFVWREGFPAWKKLTEVEELSELHHLTGPELPPAFPTPGAAPVSSVSPVSKVNQNAPSSSKQSDDLSVFTELPKAANEKTGVIDQNLLRGLKKEAKKAEKIVQKQTAKETAKQSAQQASEQTPPRNYKKFLVLACGGVVLAGAGVAAYLITQPKAPTLPALADVEAGDYQHLQAAIAQPIDQAGVHLEIAKSTEDFLHPRFYLSTNLPDNTPVDLTIKQVPGTAIEPSSAPVVIHIDGFLNHLVKTEKITISPAEYTVIVTGGPNSKTTFAAGRFFLGGTRDAAYQTALEQARAKRRGNADAELRDVNQGMAQLATFQVLLQKLIDLSKQQPINQKVLNSFHELEKSWDEAEGNLPARSEFWKPEVLEATVVYPHLLQLGRNMWNDLKATNEIFKKFFGAQPTERPSLTGPLSEQSAKAMQSFVLLKAELEKTHPGEIQ